MTPEEELELLRLRAQARARGETLPERQPGQLDWDANGRVVVPQRQTPPREPVSTAGDVVRSFTSAVPRGLAALAALPRDINDISAEWAESNQVFGDSDAGVGARRLLFGTPSTEDTPSIPWASSQELEERVLTPTLGAPYQPQTTAGEYARTIGEFAGASAFPWARGARISRTVAPAVASEAAGQATEGTPYEGAARFAGAFAGGIGNEVALARRASNVRRLGQPAPEAEALETEFGPLTRGERTGRPRQRLEEDDMRRGMGSDQAQSTLRTFDARRAQTVRDNAMRVVTRGQEPLSQDVGEAGVILGDELRTARQALRERATAQYERAFQAAQNEPIPAGMNDTPSTRIAAAAEEFGFEVPAGARTAIGNLERQIQSGQATHANVERARQALNRELGAATNARNDAQEFVMGRVINALDEWQEGALTNPEARRAMAEARSIYAETQNLFAQRGRTELTTGQTGRMDPGGRAIDRTINTDLTGEQIIDGILGTGRRPSAQTLGAVRRIKELGTNRIVYTNRNAESGVRVPGRGRVGGVTRAQRRFDADSAESPVAQRHFGGKPQQPEAVLQSLREGMWHRLLSPLDDYIARIETSGAREGGILPAQRMVTQLDNALNGSGREITATIYTAREIAAMQRLLRYFKRIVPPAGANYSGTAAALYRQLTGALQAAVNVVPGVGWALSALRGASRELSSTLKAERAVAAPRPRRAPTAREMEAPPPNAAAPALQSSVMLPPPDEPVRRLGQR
jgi:hypothetical protein